MNLMIINDCGGRHMPLIYFKGANIKVVFSGAEFPYKTIVHCDLEASFYNQKQVFYFIYFIYLFIF